MQIDSIACSLFITLVFRQKRLRHKNSTPGLRRLGSIYRLCPLSVARLLQPISSFPQPMDGQCSLPSSDIAAVHVRAYISRPEIVTDVLQSPRKYCFHFGRLQKTTKTSAALQYPTVTSNRRTTGQTLSKAPITSKLLLTMRVRFALRMAQECRTGGMF